LIKCSVQLLTQGNYMRPSSLPTVGAALCRDPNAATLTPISSGVSNTFRIKTGVLSAATCMIVYAAGCTSAQTPLVLGTVGPRQYLPEVNSIEPRGSLVVYTAFDSSSVTGDDQPRHSDYELRSSDGQLIKRVFNRAHGIGDEPATVDLVPGRYVIEARATRARRVSVPIAIEADRTTCLRLDGSEPTGSKHAAASELVRLPDGTPVGWRMNNHE